MPTVNYTSLLGLALPTTGDLSGSWGNEVNNYITQYLDAAVAGAQTISGSQTAVTLSKSSGTPLSQAGSGATGSSQYQIINCTGNPGSLLTITAPAASKVYLILNNTSTSQSVKIVGAGPTTGVTIASATNALVAWNGSDFELVASSAGGTVTSVGGTGTVNGITLTGTVTSSGNLTLGGTLSGVNLTSQVTGTLPTANGGTGLTTFTAANNALYSTSSSALTAGTLPVAAGGTGATTLTANNVILGNGTSAPLFVAPGTAGNVLTSNGTTWTSAAPAATLIGVTQSATPFKTALGYQAGGVVTGISNTLIGYQSGDALSSGTNNTAVGDNSLGGCTTGFSNTAIGSSAMGASSGTTASGCTAIGAGALSITTGNNNTAVGYFTANSLTSGSNNTFIGASIAASSATVDREIVIGYALAGKGTQTAYIGGTSGAYNAKNVTTWETTSDERIKRNIVDSPKGLAEIKQLRVRNFNYKLVEDMPQNEDGKPIIDNLDPDKLITGFIAQELQTVMPECVNTTASGLLSVSSDPIIYALVKAVQELAAEVERLKQG